MLHYAAETDQAARSERDRGRSGSGIEGSLTESAHSATPLNLSQTKCERSTRRIGREKRQCCLLWTHRNSITTRQTSILIRVNLVSTLRIVLVGVPKVCIHLSVFLPKLVR